MSYQGKTIQTHDLGDGIVEMRFDRDDESVNKFDQACVAELGEAAAALGKADGIKGVVVTSGKDVFIVGADITE